MFVFNRTEKGKSGFLSQHLAGLARIPKGFWLKAQGCELAQQPWVIANQFPSTPTGLCLNPTRPFRFFVT
jgi:hypothetical protein